MTLGVVIPVYRGQATIGAVVEELYRFAKEHRLLCRLVLVEDASGDGSREEVLSLAEKYGGVTAVLLQKNMGQQKALYYGLQYAKDCDLIATMDDDGQHPPALLDEMMRKIFCGYDLCYAVPSRRGYGLYRKTGAALRDMLFFVCTRKPRGIRVSAYRVMTSTLATKLKPEPDGFIYLSAAAFQNRLRAACLIYECGPQEASSYTVKKLFRLYAGLIFHYTPLKILIGGKRAAEDCPYTVHAGRGYLWEP